MRSVTIKSTGATVKMKNRIQKYLDGIVTPEKDHYYVVHAHGRHEIKHLTDKQAQCEFERWAGVLNEEIVLSVWAAGYPKAGEIVGVNDRPEEGETVDEVNTVYAWGKELGELESRALETWSFEMHRRKMIARMLIDAGLIWNGGPKWWHQI